MVLLVAVVIALGGFSLLQLVFRDDSLSFELGRELIVVCLPRLGTAKTQVVVSFAKIELGQWQAELVVTRWLVYHAAR